MKRNWLFFFPLLLLLIFLVAPLAAIFMRVWAQKGLWSTLRQPIVTEALRLSAVTSLSSLGLAVVLGTPLAYLLARHRFRGAALVDTLVDLPMVLPPTVAGVALLMAFGRRGRDFRASIKSSNASRIRSATHLSASFCE